MQSRLKELRNALGLSQKDFGARLEVTFGAVSSWELGARTPPASIVRLICKEFHVSRVWLESGAGSMFEVDDVDDAQRARRLVADLVALIPEEKRDALKRAFQDALNRSDQ